MVTKTASQLVTEAKARSSNLTVDQVAGELAAGDVVLVDLRDPHAERRARTALDRLLDAARPPRT
jgi:hypothetical protein